MINSFEVKTLIFILIAVVIFVLLKIIFGKKEKFPYKLKAHFLSKSDIRVIEKLAELGYIAFPKVRVSDFITTWKNAGNRPKIASRSVDFLVCDINSFMPNFVIMFKTNRDKNTNKFIEDLFEHVNLSVFFMPKNFSLKDIEYIVEEVERCKKEI